MKGLIKQKVSVIKTDKGIVAGASEVIARILSELSEFITDEELEFIEIKADRETVLFRYRR